jgi:hypothetical protein
MLHGADEALESAVSVAPVAQRQKDRTGHWCNFAGQGRKVIRVVIAELIMPPIKKIIFCQNILAHLSDQLWPGTR